MDYNAVNRLALYISNALWAFLGILTIVSGTLGGDATLPDMALVIVTVLGAVILLSAFFVHLGTSRQSAALLWTSIVILMVILALLVTIVCVSTQEAIKLLALENIKYQWQQVPEHPGALDQIQQSFKCCGLNSPLDYVKLDGRPPTRSCYMDDYRIYANGCLVEVERAFSFWNPTRAMQMKEEVYGLLVVNIINTVLAVMLGIGFCSRRQPKLPLSRF